MDIAFTTAHELQRLTIPYGPSDGYGAGFPNVGFIDLINEPGRIKEIPELAAFPELEELVVYLNSPGSAFHSLRVDSGYDFFPKKGFDHTCFTFLTVCLRRLHPSEDRIVFEYLYGRFSEYVNHHNAPRFSGVEFRLSPLSTLDPGFDRYCLDNFVHGYGFSRVAARKSWLAAFKMVSAFLIEFNDALVAHEIDPFEG